MSQIQRRSKHIVALKLFSVLKSEAMHVKQTKNLNYNFSRRNLFTNCCVFGSAKLINGSNVVVHI